MSFLKEPFFHFALIGAAIFAWFAIANPEAALEPAANEIIVTEQLVGSLSAQFQAKLNRPPSEDDIEASIDRYISNEILVREARALGIDQGDGIIRNRLVQKMGFLTASAAQSAVPDDATLEKHLQENAESFQRPAVAAFEQYGLREDVSLEERDAVLSELQAGKAPTSELVSQILPPVIDIATENQIDGAFGTGFFEQLEDLPIGQWAGPVQSGYGPHLVKLNTYQAAHTPPLAEVREKVLADWRNALAEELNKAQEKAMRETYTITRPTKAEVAEWLKS